MHGSPIFGIDNILFLPPSVFQGLRFFILLVLLVGTVAIDFHGITAVIILVEIFALDCEGMIYTKVCYIYKNIKRLLLRTVLFQQFICFTSDIPCLG